MIGVDLGLVIPDAAQTLRDGAIKPMQTPAWKDVADDLDARYAAKADIAAARRGASSIDAERDWVINGYA